MFLLDDLALMALGAAGGGAMDTGFGILGTAYQGHVNRDLMSHQDTLNKANYHYQMTQGPSLYRQGLEAAGYNPLLALGNLPSGSMGAVSGSSVSAPQVHSSAMSNYTALKQSRILDSEASIAKSEAASAKAQSEADIAASKLERELDEARLEAFRDGETRFYDSQGKELPYTTRLEFQQAYKNAIERDRYTNSREHAIAEDAVNAIHGGSSAFSNITHGMRALRDRAPRRQRRP